VEENRNEQFNEDEDRRLPFCTSAPEWAEHARLHGEDEPCDDGRAGRICGQRKGENPCPI
jgi:hypothetical protein